MTPKEFSTIFGDMFPSVPPGDARLCWEKCQSYKADTFAKSLDQHRLQLKSDFWRPDPDALESLCRRIDRPYEGQINRTAAYLQQMNAAAEVANNEAAAITELIRRLTDDELAADKAVVLATMPTTTASLLAKADPRRSPALQWWIAQRHGLTFSQGGER